MTLTSVEIINIDGTKRVEAVVVTYVFCAIGRKNSLTDSRLIIGYSRSYILLSKIINPPWS
jgi:hypothetical protein